MPKIQIPVKNWQDEHKVKKRPAVWQWRKRFRVNTKPTVGPDI